MADGDGKFGGVNSGDPEKQGSVGSTLPRKYPTILVYLLAMAICVLVVLLGERLIAPASDPISVVKQVKSALDKRHISYTPYGAIKFGAGGPYALMNADYFFFAISTQKETTITTDNKQVQTVIVGWPYKGGPVEMFLMTPAYEVRKVPSVKDLVAVIKDTSETIPQDIKIQTKVMKVFKK